MPTHCTRSADAAAARALLGKRSAPSILTPHDGEYARHGRCRPRRRPPRRGPGLARATGAIVLLKGALTAVATPDAATPDVLLAAAGVPALATAGSGDVLSGIIGAFCARGSPRSRRRRWPPTSTGGPRRSVRRRAWWPATCRAWWRNC